MNTPAPDFSLLEAALAIVRRAASGHPYANQAQLARATGVSEANISRWLSGKARPNLHKLEPVLNTLGVRLVAPEERPAPSPAAFPHRHTERAPVRERA